MASDPDRALAAVLNRAQQSLLDEWMKNQLASPAFRRDLIEEPEVRRQSADFVNRLGAATQHGVDVAAPHWNEVKGLLADISRSRAVQGFTASETALFVLSIREPLIRMIAGPEAGNAKLAGRFLEAAALMDALALYTCDVFQKSREEIISRQRAELLELSTPVLALRPGILALPLIGTLDSARAQVAMQALLEAIAAKEARVAIIDITGVPTVDSFVAQHLLKTAAAVRLMGADCIISGVRPGIAQAIVQLGVELAGVRTKATMQEALTAATRLLDRANEGAAA